MDEFEQKLRRQPPRTPPEDWRPAILEAARQSRTGFQPVTQRAEKSALKQMHTPQLALASNRIEPAGSSSKERSTFVQHASPGEDRLQTCPTLLTRFRDWLWPHPAAWASLAAIWLVLLGVHHSTESAVQSELIASRVDPREVLDAFAQRLQATERLLAGFDLTVPVIDADRVRPVHRPAPGIPPLMLITT